MLQDKLLLRRFKHGDTAALRAIYQKYQDYLLTLATALLGDINAAEDVLHDVFCNFIQSRERIKLKGNLKSYLATCTANLARDRIRSRKRNPLGPDAMQAVVSDIAPPDQATLWDEQSSQLTDALAELPHDQREVIVLHLRGELKFRQIAEMQKTSINTVKSRFRYGLDKLRSLLPDEVQK